MSTKNLDTEFYRNFYPDLNAFSDKELKEHFEIFGEREERFASIKSLEEFMKENLFDLHFYHNFHEDLKNFSSMEVFRHFVQFGKKEGRICSASFLSQFVGAPNFDVFFYKSFYEDIQHLSHQEAAMHYMYFGKAENRFANLKDLQNYAGNPDYNFRFYKEANLILQYMTNAQAVEYYKHIGSKSNQICFKQNSMAAKNFFFECNKQICGQDYFVKEEEDRTTQHNNLQIFGTDGKQYLHITDVKETFLCENYYPISDLDLVYTYILILDFANLGGGTNFFINSIVSKYKTKQTFLIFRPRNQDCVDVYINDDYKCHFFTNADALNYVRATQKNIDKIFVNHTMNINKNFLEEILSLPNEKIYITHDFGLVHTSFQPVFNIMKTFGSKERINQFDTIVIQDKAMYHAIKNFIDPEKKIIVSPLPDFQDRANIHFVDNKKIIIGVIGVIQDIKGANVVRHLIQYIQENYLNMEVIVFGSLENYDKCYYYKNIEHLNELLKIHKPNILLETSIWMETYSYTLTLSKIIGLPIATLKKPFYSVIESRLENYDRAFYFSNMEELVEIITTKKQNYFYSIRPYLYYNSFWENLFITKKAKIEDPYVGNFKHNIRPFLIYFPQFHAIPENDLTFYKGYNDLKNLLFLLEEETHNVVDFETPKLDEFAIKNANDYDLTNVEILQKQIDIITHYNIEGFAIYYYWFSINTITGKNQVMESVVNKFFDGSVNLKNRKLYLTWANEAWTKNPAFNVNNDKIETAYDDETLQAFSYHLMKFFKHENYLKIEGKPVFSMYTPWELTESEIESFFRILNETCKSYGFEGVYAFKQQPYHNNPDNSFMNLFHNLNYKVTKTRIYDNKQKYHFIDYKNYIENDLVAPGRNGIHTLVFDFDNRARMLKPNRLNCSTIVKNNTEYEKIKMMKEILNRYNRSKSEVENILLLNAFNEWGEKMVFEPSQEYGYYYLNLFLQHVRS